MIVHSLEEMPLSPRLVATIGVFDGFHRGHQSVFRRLAEIARRTYAHQAAITFAQRPIEVLAPHKATGLIDPPDIRIKTLASHVESLCVLTFTMDLANITAEAFITKLRSLTDHLTLVQGANFRFGHKNLGDVDLIREMASMDPGLEILVAELLPDDGEIISSSRIRQALKEDGGLKEANHLLGRPYTLFGNVIEGDRMGRQIGFPTANIIPEGQVIPRHGVYASRVTVAGDVLDAMTYVGRKTEGLGQDLRVLVESTLFDYVGNLYGQRIKVELLQFTRPPEDLPTLEALRERLASDERECRRILADA